MVGFLIVFCGIIFFAPEMGGYFLEYNNFIPANTLQTPDHIAPVWYFTPYYSMLRAVTVNFLWVDAKLWGIILMGGSVAIFALLPWLDRSPVKSIRYKGPIFQDCPYAFRHQRPDAWLARHEITHAALHIARADIHGNLLRLLHSYAVVQQNR